MSEFEVKDDSRHTKRKMFNALGKDLIKILTELITNCDDSYERLEKKGDIQYKDKLKAIKVVINKKTNFVEVIDCAEGMDNKILREKFEYYGADKSGWTEDIGTRGLFGKGALDVLFTQEKASIKTFKNGRFYECKFSWKENKRKIQICDQKHHLNEIRKIKDHYGISENGTVVSFQLNKKTSFPNKLKEKLRVAYMLRFILENIKREVTIVEINKRGKLVFETKIDYEFPSYSEEAVNYDGLIYFNFEDIQIEGRLKLVECEDKNKMREQYGDLEILVFDDKRNVYDNTMFDLGKLLGAEFIFGELELRGTDKIIRDKLNDKDHPEEILTDTRDGFNKRHPFYKELTEVIEPVLRDVIKKIKVEKGTSVSSDKFSEWKKALKDLNKYIEDNIEEFNDTGGDPGNAPPADGMQFAREIINITKGKKYTLRLLVNPNIIPIGSKITIKKYADNEFDVLGDGEIEVVEDKIDENGVFVHTLSLIGNEMTNNEKYIEAVCRAKDIKKKLFVSVVDLSIHYPVNGFEFYPSYLKTILSHTSKVHLFFDSNKFPIGSSVQLVSSNENIKVEESKFLLSKDNLIFNEIGKIDIKVRSEVNEITGRIVANCLGSTSVIKIDISEPKHDPEGKKGVISGWDTRSAPQQPWQKYFDTRSGRVIINTGNTVNKYYFGEELDERVVKNDKTAQRYLAELVSDEAAKIIVLDKLNTGKLRDDDFETLLDEMQKEKNNTSKIMYKVVRDL